VKPFSKCVKPLFIDVITRCKQNIADVVVRIMFYCKQKDRIQHDDTMEIKQRKAANFHSKFD